MTVKFCCVLGIRHFSDSINLSKVRMYSLLIIIYDVFQIFYLVLEKFFTYPIEDGFHCPSVFQVSLGDSSNVIFHSAMQLL